MKALIKDKVILGIDPGYAIVGIGVVEYVGNNAFAHCAKLTDIYLLRIKPIEIDNETAFPFEPCRINIPKGSVDSYQFTPKWKKYNYREVRVN